MEKLIKHLLFGGRVFKTGIAVFITALICHLLNLPTIFAVITAIVTIEPTATDSIKKGFIRFPASAIGAATSMLLTALLGEQPLTYAIATVFTIYFCHKFKLEAGIVVATITAVAMIPATSDNYFLAFVARLGTTTIGIVVSTIVNIVIFPPKFLPLIEKNLTEMLLIKAEILDFHLKQLTIDSIESKKTITSLYVKLTDLIEKTNKLCYYEREEFKYHKQKPNEVRLFHFATKRLNILQLIAFHLGNLTYLDITDTMFSNDERTILSKTIESLIVILKDNDHRISAEHYQLIEEVDRIFRNWKGNPLDLESKYHHHFQPQTIFLYELLSIHDAMEQLEQLSYKYDKASM